MDKSWRPSPKFILRRDAIRRLSKAWSPGQFLEVGAGTGTMTKDFLVRGFNGLCWDVTKDNRAILRNNLSQYASQVEVPEKFSTIAVDQFDYLLAFEVLEHIKDDKTALTDWAEKLKPGGAAARFSPRSSEKV